MQTRSSVGYIHVFIKPGTDEQFFFDTIFLDKFYLFVCMGKVVNFFIDKSTCSKASSLAFEQMDLSH